jgi:AbiV family abortive infection protein
LTERWAERLMTNAIGLVDDAAVLTLHCSYGRAQAVLVRATEELARALPLRRGRRRVVEVDRVASQ